MPGVAITSTLPTVGSTVGPTWATQLIAWCNEVEADIEANVTPSEITVNASLDINSQKLTGVGAAKFVNIPSASASSGSTNANSLEVVEGNLRFVDGNGTSIQVTSGGTVNVSSTGGIGGDYTSTTAEVSYSGSSDTYTFSDDTATARPAKINCADIELRDQAASANAITIASPTSISAAYTYGLPAAVGTGTEFLIGTTTGTTLQLDTASSLSFVPTFQSGSKFKASGAGSTTLSHFEQQGEAGTTATTVSTLGWTPIVSHGSYTPTYTHRFAWVQKIGVWVTVFANIEWQNGSGGTVDDAIEVTGLPYTAYNDASITSGAIMGMGTCAHFPHIVSTNIGYVTDAGTPLHISPYIVPIVLEGESQVRFMWRTVQRSTNGNYGPDGPAGGLAAVTDSTATARVINYASTAENSGFLVFSLTYRAQS
jgi:hypothetical protein